MAAVVKSGQRPIETVPEVPINEKRAFVFAIHRLHGLLLLISFKKRKGRAYCTVFTVCYAPCDATRSSTWCIFVVRARTVHMQLPGGRMEVKDILPHEQSSFEATGAPPARRYCSCNKPPLQYCFLSFQRIFWGDRDPAFFRKAYYCRFVLCSKCPINNINVV